MVIILGSGIKPQVEPVDAETVAAHPDRLIAEQGLELLSEFPPQGVNLLFGCVAHKNGKVGIGRGLTQWARDQQLCVVPKIGEADNALILACRSKVAGKSQGVRGGTSKQWAIDKHRFKRLVDTAPSDRRRLPEKGGERCTIERFCKQASKFRRRFPKLQYGPKTERSTVIEQSDLDDLIGFSCVRK